MKRTYEWKVDEGEVIRANEIVGGRNRFVIHDVRIWDDILIQDVKFKEAMSVSGGGATVWRKFHPGTIWVWKEQPA